MSCLLKFHKRRSAAANARNEEQLSEAYSRCVVLTHKDLAVFPSVQGMQFLLGCISKFISDARLVRQSSNTLSIDSIMSSISSTSLSDHLAILRRDLVAHFIDYLFKQPASLTASGSTGFIEHRIGHIPAPPEQSEPATRLENVKAVIKFISSHLLPSLPLSERQAFTRSLLKPVNASLLNNLLIPSLPTSFDKLHAFVEFTQKALDFEEEIIVGALGGDTNDRPIQTWVDGLAGHYERQRRKLLLERSRDILTAAIGDVTFIVEVEVSPSNPEVVPVQDDETSDNSTKSVVKEPEPELSPIKDDAWGFDDDDTMPAEETDGWGFDDDIPESPTVAEPEHILEPSVTSKTSVTAVESTVNGEKVTSADPWGLDDEDETTAPEEETAWDDPWDDPVEQPEEDLKPPPPSISVSTPVSSPPPKIATRLEKAASKGKKAVNGAGSTTSIHGSVVPPVESHVPVQPSPAFSTAFAHKADTSAPS